MSASTQRGADGAGASAQPPAGRDELAPGQLGPAHIAFFVVAAAAPLTLLAGVGPVAISLGGTATPLGYAIAGVVFALFAVGYVAMSRHIRNAGAFFAFVGSGLGRPMGVGAGFVALLAYNITTAGEIAGTGVFAHDALDRITGESVPWWVFAIVVWVAIGWLGYRRVTASARVLGFFLGLEVLILLVLAVPTLVQGGADGITFGSFNPDGLFHGGVGAMLTFTFGAFLGVEATAIYAEEAREPRRTIPRATYAAVAFLGIFYTIICWTVIVGYGEGSVVQAATDNPADLFFNAMTTYVGTGATDVMNVLLCTSLFASALAFHNEATRYFYSLGRGRVLPESLGHTHPTYKSPWVAAAVQMTISAVLIVVLVGVGADPFLQIFIYLASAGVVGIIFVQTLCSISVVTFFRRHREAVATRWQRLIAPMLAAVCLTAVLALMVANFDLLTGISWSSWVNYALLLPLAAVFVAGLVRALTTPARAVVDESGPQEQPKLEGTR